MLLLGSVEVLYGQVLGKVTDETKSPLPYAIIYVRNTTNGVVANEKGEFKINVPAGPQEIVFQYIGYKTRIEKITVGAKPLSLNVSLEPSNLEIRNRRLYQCSSVGRYVLK